MPVSQYSRIATAIVQKVFTLKYIYIPFFLFILHLNCRFTSKAKVERQNMCYSQSNLQKLIYIRKANSGYPKLIPKLLSTLVSLADVQITDLNIKKIAFMFTYQRYRAHILFLYIGKMLLNLCFLWKLLYQMVSNFKSNLPLLNQVLLSTNCSLLTQLSNLYMYLPAYMYSGKCYNYPQ